MASHGYATLVAPVLSSPYAQKPYNYMKPYVEHADHVADAGLSKVDETFPIVKDDAQKIKGTLLDYAHWPIDLAAQGKEYVFTTYGSEYKKCGGDGYVAGTKALITTGLVVTSDGLSWLSQFLSQKGAEAKANLQDKASDAQKFVVEKKGEVERKSGEVKDMVNEKKGEAKKESSDKISQAKDKALN